MPDLIPVNYDPFAPSGAAFGTLSPAEQGQVQPNFLNKAVSHLIGMAADAVATPGRIYNSPVAPTTEELIKPAADMAGFITLGAGAVPAEANALRAGIRPYSNVPDPLMGFRKNGPQKDFHGSNYSHVQDVDVTLPATKYTPQETFRDQIRGMNPDHAVERAYRNWPDAIHIQPVTAETRATRLVPVDYNPFSNPNAL